MILPIKQLLGIIFALILSWVIIHLLALFGVFLSLVYIISWLFFPQYVPSIFRHFSEEEQLVGRILPPPNFKQAIANAFLILILSLFSMGLVYLEARLVFGPDLMPVRKTARFVIPPKGQYRIGEIFPMKIEITGLRTAINVVQADFGYSFERLEVVDISTENSFATVFIQKEINNQTGYARLTGGIPNPGYQYEDGLFGTVYLRGKTSGLAQIEFLPSSMVLANDGKGSNVAKDFGTASFLILPEELTQEEREMQSVILQQRVLGEQDDETRLEFFEDERVLGEGLDTFQEIDRPKEFFLTRFIKTVNQFIFNFWYSVYDIFFD